MQSIWNAWPLPFFLQTLLLLASIIGIMIVVAPALAQEGNQWSPQRSILDYHLETDPPILIADQNNTFHVFSSQMLDENDGQLMEAVMYHQWSAESGWTIPVDILLSPFKNEARLLDVLLDKSGMMHVIFFGGDNTAANIYYSKAPLTEVGQASSWSEPVMVGPKALDPENGGLAGDGNGNLVIIYSGNRQGRGMYTVTSSDNGRTWSEADLRFPTYDIDSQPMFLHKHIGESGLLHTVWSEQNSKGHGQAVYYTNYDFVTMHWREPLQLATQRGGLTGLGTTYPIINEHQDNLILVYYDGFTNQQYYRTSTDGGQNWTETVAPFPQIGLNGRPDFVVDSNGDLHLFWGQRLPRKGAPVHGVWHSTWQETGWSDAEAAVSRSGVGDYTGPEDFDPNGVQAAISGDGWILLAWRTDYIHPPNGIWYTTRKLDVPELPVVPLPTVPSAPLVEYVAENITETPEPTREALPDFRDEVDLPDVAANSPLDGFFTGLLPVILLVLFIVIFRQRTKFRPK